MSAQDDRNAPRTLWSEIAGSFAIFAPMTADQKAVVLVAETLAKYQRKRRFRRSKSPMEFVPMAREVVATLFLLPDGQELVRDITAVWPDQRRVHNR